jgi:hypothetical protein
MSRGKATVTGLGDVSKRLKASSKKAQKGLRSGMILAGSLLQRESQKIVPIDKDVLRPSAFTRAEKEGGRDVVTVGYEANYAIFVHEDTTAQHDPGQEAKFLTGPLKKKKKRMLEIIKENVEAAL